MWDFFQTTGATPQTAAPGHVERWLDELRGLATSTIYARLSFLLSFYQWDLSAGKLSDLLPFWNVAAQARPKSPKACNGAIALSDEELEADTPA